MAKRKEFSIITFVGKVNVGKSSLLNLLSGQKDFAIVDSQPGTTADTVIARMEIHGLGPVKVLDTAGLDEVSKLGVKKRKKTYQAVEEADLTLVVIDLLNDSDFKIERKIAERSLKHQKQVLVIYNIFSKTISNAKLKKLIIEANEKLDLGVPSFCINAKDVKKQRVLVEFIKKYFNKESRDIDLLPLAGKSGYVLLNIPMDEETPTLRLLRPQDMAIERILRQFLTPVLFRMDLKKARVGDKAEKKRFLSQVKLLEKSSEGLKLVITDSQAMDIVNEWLPKGAPLTTFSVMMANYMSFGNLDLFIRGLDAFSYLKNGDKIIIMESCNHDRKCDDIGTRQIPRLIKDKLNLDLKIDFSFGRVLPENLKQYKLLIHCGGCMVDRQRYGHRVDKFKELGVPVTNYGLFLSWVNDPNAAKRVSKIFD